MAVNRGKQFEEVIRKSFEKVPDTTVIRLPDPTSGYLGIRNISDFIVYHYPYQYFIECKTVHGNTLPFCNISKNQWEGMLEVSKTKGVIAGVLCWWVDKDVTKFIPIMTLELMKKACGAKSVKCVPLSMPNTEIKGQKKRIFFDYDMTRFFKEAEKKYGKV